MAAGRVEAIGNRARGQVLLVDAFRTKAARHRERQLGAAVGSGPVDFRRGQDVVKPLLNWFRRRNLESGLDRELHYHIDRRVSDLVQSGLPEADAQRRAILEIGGLAQVREEVRDIWLTRWLRDFAYDLRFSARSFLRSPSFTATAVLSLALGIGATTAIYSLVDQVLLHALPVHQPERLVLIDWKGDQVASGFGSWNLMSYPICRDLQLAGALLRRRSLPCRHTGEPLDGRRVQTGRRGNRLRHVLFGARCESGTGKGIRE